MSTNSLLASLYGTNTQLHTTRSSSLFTKQYSFMSSINSEQKNRPSSVSKTIENSSPNQLVKWTPLIKTVHKLSAKMKKDYFFFWCRMQALVKSKNKLKQENKQNCIEISNCPQKKSQQIQQKEKSSKQTLQQSNIFRNSIKNNQTLPPQRQSILKKSPMRKQIPQRKVSVQQNQQPPQIIPIPSINKTEEQKLIKNSQISIQNKPASNEQKVLHLMQVSKQQELKKQRETKLLNFMISLSKLNYKLTSKGILSCFMRIKSNHKKIQAIHKLAAIKFITTERTIMNEVFRLFKKHSNQMMKCEIFVNSLLMCLKKMKISLVESLLKKAAEQKTLIAIKQEEKILKEKIQTKEKQDHNKNIALIKESNVNITHKNQIQIENSLPKKNEISIIVQKPKIYSQQVYKQANKNHFQRKDFQCLIPNQCQQKNERQHGSQSLFLTQQKYQPQMIKKLPLKINSSKNLTLLKSTSFIKNQKNLTVVTDQSIQSNFPKDSKNQRMKKLNRLYPQQPFLQLPDISQITLFDSTVKNYCSFLTKKIPEIKTSHTSLQSSIKLYTSKDNQYSTKSHQSFTKQDIPFSPRFEEHHIQNSKSSQQIFRKAASCADITVFKNSSSSNLKVNPHTPGSSKKIIGIFSKKKSVQLASKDSTHKDFEQKLESTKSAVLKKFDLFSEIKTQKKKQTNRTKIIIQSNQKQSQRNNTNKKLQKDKDYHAKKYSVLNFSQSKKNETFSQSKQNQDSVKKKGSSSKVVQKFYDMSAKRMGTGTKKQVTSTKNKQSQNRNTYEKSSTKKASWRNQFSKENQPSEFNTQSNKVISYEEFMRHIPVDKQLSGRTPLKEFSENEPAFQTIQFTESNFCSRDLNSCFDSCAQQLSKKTENNNQEKSKKLRSKIDKIEMNTARKMKLQIENMISQRKKNSIGILKF